MEQLNLTALTLAACHALKLACTTVAAYRGAVREEGAAAQAEVSVLRVGPHVLVPAAPRGEH